MGDSIDLLRDRLSRLTGKARVLPLTELARALAHRLWRAGITNPAALPDLSEAIDALDEAYQRLDPAEVARGHVAGQLGYLLTMRHVTAGGTSPDRDAAIRVLSEALSFPSLPPMAAAVTRLMLGQLRLMRAADELQSPSLSNLVTGASPAAQADADRAVRLFRELVDGPPMNAELTTAARGLLPAAETMRAILGGLGSTGLAGLDLTGVTEALSGLQGLMRTGSPRTPGWGLMPAFDPARFDPFDYPVPVMHGAHQQPDTEPRRRPVVAAAGPVEPHAARRALRERLSALTGLPGAPEWERALALLAADPALLPEFDDFIGAAAVAVDQAAPEDDPIAAGVDLLLMGVGLLLRDRLDGGGWGPADQDETYGDRAAAAQSLVAAAGRIPPGHPAAAAVVDALGAVLDGARPLSGPIGDVADVVAGYADTVRPESPVVTALGALCRTVTGLRSGGVPDPEALDRAVGAVPADHPRRAVLSTAAAHARLAYALRHGDRAAVRGAALAVDGSPLAPLLVALADGDPPRLRAAVERLDAGPQAPRVRAVAGAVRLLLAGHGGRPGAGAEDGDLAMAIAQLHTATTALDDDRDPGLRTRSWWRLAEAYRRRGATGDAERSRDAGRRALGGPGQDAGAAARFAGWMLSEGRAGEAFTALEVTAAVPAADTGVESLTGDVGALLLGLTGTAEPAPEPPGADQVAGALRELGASALLYLHPAGDCARMVGVLCLDRATGQLDVVANVPVSDPVESDDPGWPAIVDRWTDRADMSTERPRVLVAATGELAGVGLAAVCAPSGRRLAQDIVVSYVGSGRDAVRLAARTVRPVGDEPVFVVNPRGDREPEMADVLVVRRLFYPRSRCLGRAVEDVDGTGTREEVLAALPGASLVHFACGPGGAGGSALALAGADLLDAGALRTLPATNRGGLAIISHSGPGGFVAMSGPLLDAGFSGVIGWTRPVDDRFAALTLFLVHAMLVDHRLAPASAVSAVQRWMLDPDRVVPPYLPATHAKTIETTDLTRPSLWAALAYRGR